MNKLRGRRGRWACVVLLAALLAVVVSGIASAEKAIVGNIEFEAEGGFKPTTLSKTKLTPIAFNAEGSIRTLDGTHPPALKEVLIEADKNTAVAVKGYPACESSKIQSTDTKHALAACEAALIGTGVTTIGIAFPDSKEVLAHSKLLIFNGGESGGVITYYIHAYITVPVPAAVVTTVKIKKIHHGRYGLLATALIPKIAGGSGSVLSFSLKIDKKFTYKGKKVSVLSAKCPDGKLRAHAVGVFADGTKAATDFVKPCTGKS
ncbi:MAG TPA: hypothetical protein VGO24_02295 [Solirubrobacterales bacterium]|jgi:hypothetical protein|nr:hypothetical protein [Solirubrobacterales bacterium]